MKKNYIKFFKLNPGEYISSIQTSNSVKSGYRLYKNYKKIINLDFIIFSQKFTIDEYYNVIVFNKGLTGAEFSSDQVPGSKIIIDNSGFLTYGFLGDSVNSDEYGDYFEITEYPKLTVTIECHLKRAATRKESFYFSDEEEMDKIRNLIIQERNNNNFEFSVNYGE